MRKLHQKNTVRYYLLVVLLLGFLFFSNDFGLTDVQKTAIVMAAGIDRDEQGFVVTSQVAVPQSSDQGGASQAVQLVSRGKTVAQAFEEINAKTGWYPKLVFCKLLLFGRQAAEENVFDALDFFLRDEYLTDDCLVAVCDGSAQELLNASALVESSSSAAMSKVLSNHAERVGTVRPVNLKTFSIGYFGDSQSGTMPVLKKEQQQEKPPASEGSSGGSGGQNSENGQGGSSGGGGSSQSSSGGSSQSGEGSQGGESQDKPVFSAKQTALFVRGRWVETLNAEETFALNVATGKLRLATYSVETDGQTCTLSIKHNDPKINLDVGKDGYGRVQITVKLVAGAVDFSKAQGLQEIKDMGELPDVTFAAAEKKLAATLHSTYEKAKEAGCDVFGLQERLIKYKRRKYHQHRDTLLDNSALTVKVRFQKLR